MDNQLQQLIDAAKNGDVITLQPTQYILPVGSTNINKTITLAGVPGKTSFGFTQTPGSSTGIAINAPGVTVSNIAHVTLNPKPDPKSKTLAVVAYRVSAPAFTLSQTTFDTIDTAVFANATATVLRISRLKFFNPPYGDGIFLGGNWDTIIDTADIQGSHTQHCIRIDTNPITGANTAGQIIIRNSTFNQIIGNETIANRTSIGPTTYDNCTFSAWARCGQIGNPPPQLSAAKITIQNSTFAAGAFLQLDQGVIDAFVNNNAFAVRTNWTPIHGSGPNLRATGTGNTLIHTPGQTFGGRYYLLKGLAPTDYCNPAFTQ